MSDYCGGGIDMILQDINAGRLAIDGAYVGDCNVTIETWYSADKLMFYFESIDMPDERFCEENYLEVYDRNEQEEFQLMHGKWRTPIMHGKWRTLNMHCKWRTPIMHGKWRTTIMHGKWRTPIMRGKWRTPSCMVSGVLSPCMVSGVLPSCVVSGVPHHAW